MNRSQLRPWYAWPVVVLDFETTGPDPKSCQPVELGVVRFEQGHPVQRWSSLINPGCPIPPAATAVHGITDADVASAPTFAKAWWEFIAAGLLARAVPCAYNHGFDRAILHRLAAEDRREHALRRDLPWLDPLVVVRHLDRFVRGAGRHKLAAVCARRGIPLAAAHRSLGDAEATGRLLYALQPDIGDMTVCELLRRQELRAVEQDREFAEWQARQPPTPPPSSSKGDTTP